MGGWRVLDPSRVSEAVEELAARASLELPKDVESAIAEALERETSSLGRYALGMILENAEVARREGLPLCQDTGMFHLFVELGEGVALPHSFQAAVDEGIRRATRRVPLRSSLVDLPIRERRDRGDNTPVRVHVSGGGPEGEARLTLLAKGGGSENATSLHLLLPGEGEEGVRRVVLEAVRARGAQACPPLVVCVGVGGDAGEALELALRGLLRPVGERNPRGDLARLEEELLAEVNATGIGAAGLGGDTTALDVHLQEAPTHIACLPVGVVLGCHALRRSTALL
ncbi:fumarate hydratase [Candidatus Solincola tengchongensis]|uniref:fumarate hydratase n=1 Tax=Candidatus Solincola tengchongensis TaxID=2900693 RepID=UPI00257A1253|nr:fumarate hydratase [Candidatus Solincola tengchongensis]